MNSIDIYRGAGLLTTIYPDDNSVQTKKIMGENQLNISFKMNHYVHFLINDYCTVFDEVYTLNRMPVVRKLSTRDFEYTVVMESQEYDLAKVQYLFLGADNLLTETEFSLMGNAETFLDLIFSNIARTGRTGWVKGQVLPTVYKTLTFNRENCHNALARIAEAFDTEFWVIGKTIHVTKKRSDTGLKFRVGQNKGLYELTRTNLNDSNLATRIYAQGSEKNLPPDYRNYAKRLKMAFGEDYVQQYTAFYGIIEHSQIFEDIYPHRTGTVTGVDATNFYKLSDTGMDFDLNDQLMPGKPAKIVFNTGQLAGYEFKIKSYDHSLKTFTILKNDTETALDVPSDLLKPAIGDKYVLVDIIMPDTYVNAAEEELTAAATILLGQVSTPQLSYTMIIDPLYVKRYGLTISLGDEVTIQDNEIDINRKIRIIGISREIVNQNKYQVDLSDALSFNTIQRIISSQDTTGRNVADVQTFLNNYSVMNRLIIGDLRIEQGSIVIEDIDETAITTGFSQLYIDNSTGKIYRKV